MPSTIKFVPPAQIIAKLQEDYRQMQTGFIYAEAPSFEQIMKKLAELQRDFNYKIQWE